MSSVTERFAAAARERAKARPARRSSCPAPAGTTLTSVGERPAARRPTLDELLVGAWEDLRTAAAADCPVCGGTMLSRRGAGPAGERGAARAAARRSPERRVGRLCSARRSRATVARVCQAVAAGEKSRRGKSGHHRARWSGDRPGETRGKVPQKSHRRWRDGWTSVHLAQARLKWCGKSAPASW